MKAVLVNLTIGSLTNERTDNAASQAVATQFSASTKSGRYLRKRLPTEQLSAIQKLQREMRAVHYRMAAPWYDGGIRILPANLILPYQKEYRRIEQEMNKEVDRLCEALPQMKTDFAKTQAGLFRALDFPSEEEVRAGFRMNVDLIPVGQSEDFRLDVISEAAKSEFDKKNKERTDAQNQHMVGQIRDLVGKLAANFVHDSPKIRETTVEQFRWFYDNLEDLFLDETLPAKLRPIIEPIYKVVVAEYDPESKPKFNPLAVDEGRIVVNKANAELQNVT